MKYIEETVIPMVKQIRKSASKEAFKAMTDAALKKFKEDDENEFATYFKAFYLSDRWCGWYVEFMPIRNVGFTNNAMESANAKIKKLVSGILTSPSLLSLMQLFKYNLNNYILIFLTSLTDQHVRQNVVLFANFR